MPSCGCEAVLPLPSPLPSCSVSVADPPLRHHERPSAPPSCHPPVFSSSCAVSPHLLSSGGLSLSVFVFVEAAVESW